MLQFETKNSLFLEVSLYHNSFEINFQFSQKIFQGYNIPLNGIKRHSNEVSPLAIIFNIPRANNLDKRQRVSKDLRHRLKGRKKERKKEKKNEQVIRLHFSSSFTVKSFSSRLAKFIQKFPRKPGEKWTRTLSKIIIICYNDSTCSRSELC